MLFIILYPTAINIRHDGGRLNTEEDSDGESKTFGDDDGNDGAGGAFRLDDEDDKSIGEEKGGAGVDEDEDEVVVDDDDDENVNENVNESGSERSSDQSDASSGLSDEAAALEEAREATVSVRLRVLGVEFVLLDDCLGLHLPVVKVRRQLSAAMRLLCKDV